MELLHKQINQHGQFLVELLVAIALAAIVLPVLFLTFVSSREGKAEQDQRLKAMGFLKEEQEAARVVRQRGWDSFAVNGTYHPATTSATWSFVLGTEQINGFFRNVVISDGNRSASGAAVETGGTSDPSTKKLIFSVWWTTPHLATVSAETFLTRYLGDATFVQTSQNDFDAGTKNSVSVTQTGEVTLAEGGHADWCIPQPIVSEFDLPRQGVANAISAIEGRVFAGTGDNASGVSFANVNISNTSSPSGTLVGTFDGYKTNDVFGEENYAYLATNTGSKEIVIIDLTHKDSNNNYSEIGYFDAPANKTASSVFASGNIGYITDQDMLYTFDLSSKIGSRPQLGSIALAGTAAKVKVVDNYAYVVLDATPQLQVIKVSPDGKTLSFVGEASVNGLGARDVFVNSLRTRAYLATKYSFTQSEMFIIDTSPPDPPSWWPFPNYYTTIGSYDTGNQDPKGITVVTANKAIVVGVGGEQYQAVNIANESSPIRCGGMNIATGINGVSSVLENDGDAYSYIIAGDANSELKIILGGPGGGTYSSSGTFVSNTLDASPSGAFNSFNATVSQPQNTSITFQVAAANAVANSCASAVFDFLGPDGTGSTYFATSSAAIPTISVGNYANPARCFKYKAYLSTTSQNATPTLYDMTINYSP